ncbi:PAS domain-containing protein [Hymenobacter sp. BT635]|uniref:histidine kinase n=1 Tax=Hymenobacter nitidus TaxID=2880929 RepID=A0ABS8ABK7_9BACT|nr:PAS domain-containing protein [Hymenobacter nitidus]MCB2376419.1 PAS domain-containing protein [Hymenobacter nitidus]
MPVAAVDFHLIFDSLPTPHLILSPTLAVVAVNEAACRVLHKPAAELVGQDALAILPPSVAGPEHTASLWRQALREVLEQLETRTVATQRYDIPHRTGPTTSCYWQATLRPVLQEGHLRHVVCRVLDVTEQVLAEERGSFSHESFNLLTQATHDAIWDIDMRTGTVWRNEMFTTLFGHPSGLSPDSQLWQQHVHPEERTAVEAARLAIMEGPGSVLNDEYRFRRADGSWAEVIDRAYIVRDEAGRAVRLLGAMQDVTQQRQAEHQARQHALRFQLLAEVQPQLIWTTDTDGIINYVNPYWEQYMGMDLAESRNWGWGRQAHPDDLAQARQIRQRTFEQEQPFELEMRLRQAQTDQYRWFLVRAVPAYDAEGAITQWVGAATDINDQKRTEQALQQSNTQFGKLLESLPQMAWTSDPDGRVNYYNQRWYDYTDSSFAELRDWENFVHPDDLPTTQERWRHAIAHHTRFETEHRWRNHYGQYRWFLARAEPIHDDQGQLISWVGTNTDIDESRQVRDQMQEKDRLLRRIMGQIPANIGTLLGPDHVIGFVNDGMKRLYGPRAVSGARIADALPEVEEQGFVALMQQVYTSGQPYYGLEQLTLIENEQTGEPETHYLDFTYQPLRDEAGQIQGILVFAVEVTDRVLSRRRALALDAAVRQRDEEMRVITEALPQITYISTPTGQPSYLSPQWFAYTGQATADNLGELQQQATHPDDWDATAETFSAALAARQIWSGELRLRHHSGQYRWHLSRAVPMLNEQGQVLRWYGSTTDIHEQKQIQATLRWSQERYELAALATNDAIWDWNLLTNEVAWNPAIERVFGHHPEGLETTADWWYAQLHPDDAARVVEGIHVVIDSTEADWQSQYRFRRADGSYAQVFDRGYVSRDAAGRATRMIGAIQDVTQQRLAETALSQREKEFTTLANSMPQLAWMANPDGHIFWYNEQWYAYTGTTLAEMQGFGWQKVHHPDYVDTVTKRWLAALSGEQAWKDTFPLRGQDGDYRWFLSWAQPVHDAQGHIVRWIGTNTDITEARRIEQQLKEQNVELRRINEDLDNFVYTASHDLKQPIHNMAGIFEELTRTAYFRDPEAIKLISMFERALQQIYDTIYNLSELVQVQKLRHELPTEAVALEPLAREVLDSIGEQLANVRAIVTTDFAAAPVVHFVRPNLQSVLYNLVSNALKYAAPKRTPRIHLWSKLEDDHIVLYARDNGVGIDLERYGSQLFQMFRRFHDHVSGSGMGLYLVNRIVQSYGGRIEVQSEVGKGTTFSIYIPVGSHALAPAPQESVFSI